MLGTTAQPENLINNTVRAERAHYFEVGSSHALTRWTTLEFTAYYKLARYLSDAGQFGTTPLLNYFAFDRGWQRGVDGALKVRMTDNLTARATLPGGNVKAMGCSPATSCWNKKRSTISIPGVACFAITRRW